jgi:N-acetylmuramoyl-L-alanine amidase
MKFYYLLILALVFAFVPASKAQITGLSGWNIYLDPGHSQDENAGIYGLSEAKKNLRVALDLRARLLNTTDIDTVYICRTNDDQLVSLEQRTDEANSLGAAWYHSCHSDAADSPNNNTCLLLWGQYANGTEKVPNGGHAMSDPMIGYLVRLMRAPSGRSWGDCSFYGCTGTGPYLWVNRTTNMPSELHEAGFHTNPVQNQLNMNKDFRHMQATSVFWAILKYKNIAFPTNRTLTGIITDIETGVPVNGAVVTYNGLVDTTDSYESVFHNYTTDPNLLHNGYYFFEGLPSGSKQLKITKPGYEVYTSNVAPADTFVTFVDPQLVSIVPPKVIITSPAGVDSIYPGLDNITITFSRPMNKTSVESNLSFSPAVGSKTFGWSTDQKTLTISTESFAFNTNYQATISGQATDKYGHLFDGNGDSTGGDPYTFTFRTKSVDVTPPAVSYFAPDTLDNRIDLKPLINVSFDEQINTSTISGRFTLVKAGTSTAITTNYKYYVVNKRSVMNFVPSTNLEANTLYTFKVAAGIKDRAGNATTTDKYFTFKTSNYTYTDVNSVDNFESGIANWYQPQQSGSTVGIVSDQTSASLATTVFNLLNSSAKSMMLKYGWDTTAANWLIREYYTLSTPVFSKDNILQAYVFGDGSNNQLRMGVKDNSAVEVNLWQPINWIGWKKVEWYLSKDALGSFNGNGTLDGNLKFDSFQLTYDPSKKNTTGTIYFDDIKVVSSPFSGITEDTKKAAPTNFVLGQNYPNPFNPSTLINFSIPEQGFVSLDLYNILGQKVTNLFSGNKNAGNYVVSFNTTSVAGGLPSGTYFYRMTVTSSKGTFTDTRKMVLMK